MPKRNVLSLLLVGLMAGLLAVHDAAAQQPGGRPPRGQGQGQDGGGRGRPGGGFDFGGRGGPPGGGFGGSPLLGLLRVDEVRQELKVTEDQVELVEILGDDLREGAPAFPQNFRELSDEEREAFSTKMREFGEQQSAKARESLAVILDEAQLKRLNEINVQVQGTRALTDPEVAKTLKISEELQKQITAKMDSLREESRQQMGDLFRSGDREAAMKKMQEMQKSHETQVVALLSPEQQQAFEKMKGAPFAMPEGFGRGGGGRGFGGGPPGGQGGGGRPGGGPSGGNRPQRPQ